MSRRSSSYYCPYCKQDIEVTIYDNSTTVSSMKESHIQRYHRDTNDFYLEAIDYYDEEDMKLIYGDDKE